MADVGVYFPTRLTMANIRTIVNMPAALIAAAVKSPDMPDATVRPANISVTTNIRTAPSGVLIMSTMLDVPFPKAFATWLLKPPPPRCPMSGPTKTLAGSWRPGAGPV